MTGRARTLLVLAGLVAAGVAIAGAQAPAPRLQITNGGGDLYRFRFAGASGVFLVTAEGLSAGASGAMTT